MRLIFKFFMGVAVSFYLLFATLLFGQEIEGGEEAKTLAGEVSEEVQAKSETGSTITIDFKDADIRNVLRIISQKAGINIIAAPEVEGRVTAKFDDVEWEIALDTILKTYGLGYERKANIIRVAKLGSLKLEKEEELALQKASEEKEEVKIEVVKLNYIEAIMAQNIIQGGDIKMIKSEGLEYKEESYKMDNLNMLTKDSGKIQAEPKTNSLIIHDRVSVIEKVKKVISEIDKPTAQILIESKIIETNLTDDEDFGIKWNITGDIGLTQGGEIPTTFPFDKREGTRGKFAPTINPANRGTSTTSKFPTSTATNPLQGPGYEEFWPYLDNFASNKFSLGTLSFAQLQILLEALASRSNTELLANPSVVTLNKHLAMIDIVTEWPIPEWGFNDDTGAMVVQGITKEKYGIIMAVRPTVYQDSKIELLLRPEVTEKSGDTTIGGATIPILDVEAVQSRVLINSGDTVVVGGLIKNKKVKTISKVPILGDIPLLGLLFRHSDTSIVKKDLIIFVTATVINSEELVAFSKGKESGKKKK